jgi:dihydrofolate synthase/folylpolyglutamate synthase
MPSQRARALLARLDYPERCLPPVIHVGGTKGKGSIIAFLRAMLEAAGYKVHAYTSPHLARFNERIVLAGREIGDNALFDVIEETRIAAGDTPVGFFDATTAAAMLAFSRTPADILLMEMGLGGLVDATNIIDTPRMAILTTVSYDHMEYMGSTLASIAAFEAGLFKPHVPAIVSYQHAEVWPVLEQAASATQVPLYCYGKHWNVRRSAQGMVFSDGHGEVELPLPALPGAHQMVNAAAAIAAVSALEEFEVDGESIVHGLRNAQWKGRLQHMPTALPEGCELWFDGGHNSAAAQAIALHVEQQWADMPFYLIFGTTQGKDIETILAPFAPLARRIYAVEVKSEPKSYRPDAIVHAAPGLQIQPAESIADALEDIQQSSTIPFRVLVFGSLYLWLETTLL